MIIEQIRRDIQLEKYKYCPGRTFWGGAGAIITENPYPNGENDPNVEYLCNANARYIIWLINRILPYAKIDYITKYEFYPNIVKSAKKYISEHNSNEIKGLLNHILESIQCWLEDPNNDRLLVSLKRSNAYQWYIYGLEHNEDYYAKFIMHWMAFNCLYNQFYQLDKKIELDSIYGIGERERIQQFIRRYPIVNFNPFSEFSVEVEIFKKGPVFREYINNPPASQQVQLIYEQIKGNNFSALIQAIYTVRCNLMHGSKDPSNERNCKLVSSSAIIMETYMKNILSAGLLREHR